MQLCLNRGYMCNYCMQRAAILAGFAKKMYNYFRRGYMCKYCMQRAAVPGCNNCMLSNVFKNIHEAKVLQPMTAFGRIT